MAQFSFDKLKKLIIIGLFLSQHCFLFSSHNASRYFPFLEKPEDYISIGKKTNLTPSLFLTTASTAYQKGGGNAGIPELWGKYDIKDIIFALKQVNNNYIDPTFVEKGTKEWIGKSIKFDVDGKITSRGVSLGYNQDLHFWGLCVGAFIPFAHVNTTSKFSFNDKDSEISLGHLKSGEQYQVDRIRGQVQDDLGIKGSDWSNTGFGDLDLFVSWNNSWDHELLIKNIDLNLRVGVLFPTGITRDIDYPTSVAFSNDGHWGAYFDSILDLELKQDLRVGVILGFMDLFKKTELRRVSVYKEPVIFSPLKADIQINPGFTFKFSSYLEFENLRDGLHFQGRYTYLKHGVDSWKDLNDKESVKSYLDQEVTSLNDLINYPRYVSDEKIKKNKEDKEYLSKWTSHYLTLEVIYDSREAFNNWWLSPAFYFIYDYPMSGGGIAKTHQFTVGVELHF